MQTPAYRVASFGKSSKPVVVAFCNLSVSDPYAGGASPPKAKLLFFWGGGGGKNGALCGYSSPKTSRIFLRLPLCIYCHFWSFFTRRSIFSKIQPKSMKSTHVGLYNRFFSQVNDLLSVKNLCGPGKLRFCDVYMYVLPLHFPSLVTQIVFKTRYNE